jgi:hypothetical protein
MTEQRRNEMYQWEVWKYNKLVGFVVSNSEWEAVSKAKSQFDCDYTNGYVVKEMSNMVVTNN